MTRREAREQAFSLLFEKSFNPESEMNDIVALAPELRVLDDDKFVKSLVYTACEKQEEIDEHISANARGWKLNRISKVPLAIIRLALAEILYFEDIPNSVSINEAVELAKKYANPEDASFINGLLGTVARKA